MMNLLQKRIGTFLLILLSVFGFGQTVPPPPENPESGDIGAYPASPIDGYTFLLFLVAMSLMIFFALRSRQGVLK